MTTLTEFEALADAYVARRAKEGGSLTGTEDEAIDWDDSEASNPATVLRLIALCRMQNAAIKRFEGDHWYEEDAGEAVAAFDAFEQEGK